MSRLKWNQGWDVGEWRIPKQPARELVAAYCELAAAVPGVLGVWAAVREATLNIYTLVSREGEAEKQAYEIEMKLYDMWPDLPVRFHVYNDKSSLKEAVRHAEPILVAA